MDSKIRRSQKFPLINTDRAGTMMAIISALLAMSISLHAGTFDGPAELPRVYIQSSLANTPAPGKTLSVPAGGNIQAALNQASCGDTVRIQAGATFTGYYTFPAKKCDNGHWIIVRTSAPDTSLPPEGTRIKPCYAGVGSLPGRPAFNCTSTANVMVKLVTGNNLGSGPIVFAPGANHYRLIGLEVTRQLGGTGIFDLAFVPTGGSASYIVFDRMWLHGNAKDDTERGVLLSGLSNVAIVDSFFTDFHCTALTGSCSDAQAIAGGIGTAPSSTYKIVNNFLEASTENIMFGGGSSSLAPADIEIRRNHLFKPLSWKPGQPNFVGGRSGNPFVVKNLFELKNAQRVLFEGNILENTWGGFSQVGFAVLLTPQNQFSRKSMTNVCPMCQVTDVTVRYNTISHVAAGFQIANPVVGYNGAGYIGALAGERYSIHDVVVDDINGAKYLGPSLFAQITSATGAPLLNNVSIDHVTAFAPKTMLIIGNRAGAPKIPHLTVTNSIFNAGPYPIWSSGGTTNCAAADVPLTTFNACFSPYFFNGNVVFAPSAIYPPATWPSGNYFPSTVAAVGFVNYNNGIGGNYQLTSASPYRAKSPSGKNIGADIAAINQLTTNVY